MNEEPLRLDKTADYDALGRKQLRQIPVTTFLNVSPPPPGRVRRVPHQAVKKTDGRVVVTCPCGTNQETETGVLVNCAGCERWYLGVGVNVWVLYGEMDIPASS